MFNTTQPNTPNSIKISYRERHLFRSFFPQAKYDLSTRTWAVPDATNRLIDDYTMLAAKVTQLCASQNLRGAELERAWHSISSCSAETIKAATSIIKTASGYKLQ